LEGAIVGALIVCEILNDVGDLVVVVIVVGALENTLNIDIVGTRVGNALGLIGTGALENTLQESPFPGIIVGGPAIAVGVKVG